MRAAIERQLGRLLQRNSRSAARYQIELRDDATLAATVRLQWAIRADWERAAELSEGCYVLRTNVANFTAEQTWQTYMQLTQAEAAFRIHKSELSTRPVWHHKARRVRSLKCPRFRGRQVPFEGRGVHDAQVPQAVPAGAEEAAG